MTTLHFASPPSSTPRLLRALVPARAGRPWPTLVAEQAPAQMDRARLAAYRRICGIGSTAALPATVPQVLAVPMHIAMLTDPTFPLPAMGVVHVSQRIEVLAPIADDAAIALRATLSEPRSAKRGTMFSLDTEGRVDGELVWRGSTAILSRTAHPDARPAPESADGEDDAAQSENRGDLGRHRSAMWSVPEDLGRRYTRIAGDFNPIHLWSWTARPFGFKRAIIHGMWTLGRALGELDDDVPSAPFALDIAFRRPIPMPSRVCFDARRTGDGVAYQVLDPRRGRVHAEGRVAPLPTAT
jgi:acyl dehydratase